MNSSRKHSSLTDDVVKQAGTSTSKFMKQNTVALKVGSKCKYFTAMAGL
jgi:hypothetical protein